MNSLAALLVRLGVAVPVALGLGVAAYLFLLPAVIWSLYTAELSHHDLAPPDVGHGAGSADLYYEVMTYDCTEGDVVIEGEAPNAPYWMFGIYDLWARALDGGHVNHRTVPLGADGRFRVVVTDTPRGLAGELDCRRSPRGMLMYRVLLPAAPVAPPTVRLEGAS